MSRAIITGGTGFVGANLVRRLLREGHEVHLLVRPEYASWRIDDIRRDVQLHETDLENQQALVRIVEDVHPDWIFHLAAFGAYSWQKDNARIFSTNVLGTMNLLEACLKIGFQAFVNTGSSSEYGFKDHPPLETELPEPNSAYAVAKVAATLYCRHIAHIYGVNICTLRLYSAYGPYEEPARLLPSLIIRGLQGDLPPLVSPTVARDYVYVEDVCSAYLLAAQTPGQEPGAVYNVGTGSQTSIGEVVALAQESMAITSVPKWGSMPDRQWDTSVWVADTHKIRAKLGWQPHHMFQDGFKHMVEWFRANPAMLALYEQRMNLSSTPH